MKKSRKELRSIDARIYAYWQALFMSFYSSRLYVDIGKRWRGLGFIYLLLLIAVFSIPLTVRVVVAFNQTFEQKIIKPLSKMPVLLVQNGEISTDEAVPYLVRNDEGKVVLIVDPSGKVADFGPEYPDLSILVKKDGIYFKLPSPNLFSATAPTNTSPPVVQRLDKSVNAVFSGSQFTAEPNIARLQYTSEALVYPIVVSAVFSFFAIVYPVLALLGQVFAYVFFAFQLRYLQSLRLLIVSGSPMMLVMFAFLTINRPFSWMGVVLLLLLIVYYAFAVRALRAESKQLAK